MEFVTEHLPKPHPIMLFFLSKWSSYYGYRSLHEVTTELLFNKASLKRSSRGWLAELMHIYKRGEEGGRRAGRETVEEATAAAAAERRRGNG